jgi:hypothetical protein
MDIERYRGASTAPLPARLHTRPRSRLRPPHRPAADVAPLSFEVALEILMGPPADVRLDNTPLNCFIEHIKRASTVEYND